MTDTPPDCAEYAKYFNPMRSIARDAEAMRARLIAGKQTAPADEHPAYDQVIGDLVRIGQDYAAGRAAHEAGMEHRDCPHGDNGTRAVWQLGWIDAEVERRRRVAAMP